MWVTDLPVRCGRRYRQNGSAAVEFALVAIVFFVFVFAILELARIVYMYNTLAKVTGSAARAAANIDFRDASALDLARRRAIFDDPTGRLPFGDPATYANLHIDYLYVDQASNELKPVAAAALSCPAQVRLNCLTNRSSSNCVRAVRVRVCSRVGADGTCEPLNYQPLFSLLDLDVKLPISSTIVNAETLGYSAGDPLCSGS